MRYAITGLGVVSPLGVGAEAFFAALDAGARAPTTDSDGLTVARVGDFGAKQKIAPGSLRRLPRLSQLAIVAGKEALAESAPPYDATRVGVVLGTGLGTLEETIAFMRGYLDGGPEAASPLLFPSSVMNAAAGQLALECKLRGVNSTVNHRDASPLSALTMACDLLALGRADALVVGAVDELSAPALAGYRALGAGTLAGVVWGEGAAMMIVEREDDAKKRGAKIRAYVSGRGERGDDRPRVGWGHAAAGPEAARAVRQAVAGGAVDAIVSGANGTAYDAREAAALGDALDGAAPPRHLDRARCRRVALLVRAAPRRRRARSRARRHPRARARIRARRRQRRRRPRARLMSRTTRTPSRPTPSLPRVVARKPRRGDVHPLPPAAIRELLRALPSAQLRGLVRVELRARTDEVGTPFAIYRREERDIILYSLPPDEWWMSALDRDCARDLREAGARIVRHRLGVSIHFADGGMDTFMRHVLAHEIGHHVRNQIARYPRTARTADEEAVADLHARRTRTRLSVP